MLAEGSAARRVVLRGSSDETLLAPEGRALRSDCSRGGPRGREHHDPRFVGPKQPRHEDDATTRRMVTATARGLSTRGAPAEAALVRR
jgi:hypothetical protein